MRKNISKLLLGVLSLTLVSCMSQKEALKAPTVISLNDIVSWNKIDGASDYQIYVDDVLVDIITDTFYEFDLANGTYKINVVAIDNTKKHNNSTKSIDVNYVKGVSNKNIEMYKLLDDVSYEFDNLLNDSIEFVNKEHLKKEYWYEDTEYTFYNESDSDGGYRAEFWGKNIRGGVFTYQYNHDEELYNLLKQSVRNMLDFQKTTLEGRLSGFSVDTEFSGWDLRAHVYTLYGFYYFHEICKDEAMKQEIVESLRKQVDYVVKRIGPSQGQIDILSTSPDWGATTSCNILDGIIKAYTLVKDPSYLEFAKYIIDTGLSSMRSSDGKTLVESALANDPLYKWGCRKMYEDNVCFEGVLDMYLVTGNEYYLRLAKGFYNAVSNIETTLIGSCAVDVEEGCHSTVEQFNPYNLGRMNETCVQTTWLRYLLKLFLITGDSTMMDHLERLYYNFGYGSIDWEIHNNFPLFSYSPLSTMARADIYSGTAFIGEHNHVQSCCVLSGLSFMPVVAKAIILASDLGFAVNLYIDGKINAKTPKGNDITFITNTTYPKEGIINTTLELEKEEEMTISFRIPSWSKNSKVIVNDEEVSDVKSGSYVNIKRVWKNNDNVRIELDMNTHLVYGSEECSSPYSTYNVVVERGPIVFARDSRLEGLNIYNPVSFKVNDDNTLNVQVIDNLSFDYSQVEINVELTNGEYLHLVDYGAAGKTMDDNSVMSMLIPTLDYYSVDLTNTIVIKNDNSKTPFMFNSELKHLEDASAYGYTTDPNILINFAVKFIKKDNGKYIIKSIIANKYLYVGGDYRLYGSDNINDASEFSIKQNGINTYKIFTNDGLVLSLHDTGIVYITDDIKHPRQNWQFLEIEYDD